MKTGIGLNHSGLRRKNNYVGSIEGIEHSRASWRKAMSRAAGSYPTKPIINRMGAVPNGM